MKKIKIKYMAIGAITGLFVGSEIGFVLLNSTFEGDGVVVYPFFKNKTKEYKVTTYSFSQEDEILTENIKEEYLSKPKIDVPLELNIYGVNIANKENKDIATYTYDELDEKEKDRIIDSFKTGDYEYIIENCDIKDVNYDQEVTIASEADLTIRIADYNDFYINDADNIINSVCNFTMGLCSLGFAAIGSFIGSEVANEKTKNKEISKQNKS